MQDCDPANYAKVHRKPRCPVPGCKEKLVASNTYQCRDCATTVCLKHRFAKDHSCSERAGGPQPSCSRTRHACSTVLSPLCIAAAAARPGRATLAGAMSRVLGLAKQGRAAQPQPPRQQAQAPARQKPPRLPDRSAAPAPAQV